MKSSLLDDMKKYFYYDGGNQLGPFTFEELKDEMITKDHLVWFDPMEDWEAAGNIDELGSLFSVFDISKPTSLENKVYQPEEVIETEVVSIDSRDQFSRITVPQRPTNYLWQSIVVTVVFFSVCTLPFGIMGIINASKVNSAYNRGDYEEALRASKMAKQWTSVSFVIGCVSLFLVVISLIMN